MEVLKKKGRAIKSSDKFGRYECSKCKEWKYPSEFNKNKQQKSGLTYACRECMRITTRKWNLPAKYNITVERFDEMLKEQNYKCACCEIELDTTGKQHNKPHVDHNHLTGEVRNILCGNCNLAAGKVKDSSEIAIKLANYLIKWNC
jgi:Zn finger protein HypA/HybF involved in hydrogenase expression